MQLVGLLVDCLKIGCWMSSYSALFTAHYLEAASPYSAYADCHVSYVFVFHKNMNTCAQHMFMLELVLAHAEAADQCSVETCKYWIMFPGHVKYDMYMLCLCSCWASQISRQPR